MPVHPVDVLVHNAADGVVGSRRNTAERSPPSPANPDRKPPTARHPGRPLRQCTGGIRSAVVIDARTLERPGCPRLPRHCRAEGAAIGLLGMVALTAVVAASQAGWARWARDRPTTGWSRRQANDSAQRTMNDGTTFAQSLTNAAARCTAPGSTSKHVFRPVTPKRPPVGGRRVNGKGMSAR